MSELMEDDPCAGPTLTTHTAPSRDGPSKLDPQQLDGNRPTTWTRGVRQHAHGEQSLGREQRDRHLFRRRVFYVRHASWHARSVRDHGYVALHFPCRTLGRDASEERVEQDLERLSTQQG